MAGSRTKLFKECCSRTWYVLNSSLFSFYGYLSRFYRGVGCTRVKTHKL